MNHAHARNLLFRRSWLHLHRLRRRREATGSPHAGRVGEFIGGVLLWPGLLAIYVIQFLVVAGIAWLWARKERKGRK